MAYTWVLLFYHLHLSCLFFFTSFFFLLVFSHFVQLCDF